MKFLKSLMTSLKKRKAVLLPLLMLGFFIGTPSVFAANTVGEITEQSLATMVTTFIMFLNSLLWPILLLIGDLMDTDLILGPGMEDKLLGIWVEIRNLVNIGFVLVLLAIAFYNVLGLGSEGNLALKTALPRLVIGLVLVNFTFLGGRLVVDAANLATTAVFALPASLESPDLFDFQKQKATFTGSVCYKQYSTDPEEPSIPYAAGDVVPIYTQLFCDTDADEEAETEESGTGMTASGVTYLPQLNEFAETRFFADLNAANIGVLMATNMGSLHALTLVKDDNIQEFSDLLINSIFSLAMFVVFSTSYIILGVVLLYRIVVIWVALALSPVIVLFYVVPQLKESAGGGLDIGQQVTKHLMAPIIIGLVLTIGYIMVAAMQDLNINVAEQLDQSTLTQVINGELLITNIADFQDLLVALAGIVVVWFGIASATSGTYAESLTGTIQGAVTSAGKFAASLPLYSQFIPLPVSGNSPETFSPAALTQSITSLPSLLQGVRSQEVDKIYRRLGLDNGGSRINRDASEADSNNYRTNMENLTTHLAQGIKRDELDSISKIMAAVAKDSSTVNDADKEDLIKRINEAGKIGNATVLNDVLRNELKDSALQQYSIEDSLARGAAAKPAPASTEPTSKSKNYNAAVDSLKTLTTITEAQIPSVGERIKKVIENSSELDEEKKKDLTERTTEAVTDKKVNELNAILRETGESQLQSTTLTIAPAAAGTATPPPTPPTPPTAPGTTPTP